MSTAPRAYRLCEHCIGRQGGDRGAFQAVEADDCYLCEGLMGRIPAIAKNAVRTARKYQFRTFAVGVALPEGVQEREDELRADLKLKGSETVKVQTAKLVAGVLSASLGKKVDRFNPDLMLLLDERNGTVIATSRPLYYYARYTKPRGVPQRRSLCSHCGGRGCEKCAGTGFDQVPSLEGALRIRFSGITRSESMRFTWLGSEDPESLVYPPGRPFVVAVRSPVRRAMPRRLVLRMKKGQAVVSSGRVLPSKPVRLPSFRLTTDIVGVAKSRVDEDDTRDLKRRFRRTEVTFERPYDRPTVKMVYRVTGKAKGRTLELEAELDGGLPVKRFVSGELVSPSISEVLKTEVRCRRFDIRRVKETGRIEFAEVARIQKKN